MESAKKIEDLSGDGGITKQVIQQGQGETCPSNATVFGLFQIFKF